MARRHDGHKTRDTDQRAGVERAGLDVIGRRYGTMPPEGAAMWREAIVRRWGVVVPVGCRHSAGNQGRFSCGDRDDMAAHRSGNGRYRLWHSARMGGRRSMGLVELPATMDHVTRSMAPRDRLFRPPSNNTLERLRDA